MESLRGFWRWFEAERPLRVTSRDLERLSGNGKSALSYAAEQVFLRDATCVGMENAIRRYPEAVQRLSVTVCAALEQMCDELPDRSTKTSCEHAAVKVIEKTSSCVCERCGTILVLDARLTRSAAASAKHR
jgi:hypothetical protein